MRTLDHSDLEIEFDGNTEKQPLQSLQFVNGGGCMTLDYNGNLRLFLCEHLSDKMSCKSLQTEAINIKDKFDTVYHRSSYGNEVVQAYSFGKTESDTSGSVTLVFGFKK